MKGMDTRNGAQVIKADVPPVQNFLDMLRIFVPSPQAALAASLTFSHYAPVPRNLAEKIMTKLKAPGSQII